MRILLRIILISSAETLLLCVPIFRSGRAVVNDLKGRGQEKRCQLSRGVPCAR